MSPRAFAAFFPSRRLSPAQRQFHESNGRREALQKVQ
jgi:hypothetical protein